MNFIKRMKNKRGMETMAFILIALILAALVLVSLSGGLQVIIGKIKLALGGNSNVDVISGFCNIACELKRTSDYCYKQRTLTDTQGNRLNDVTCYFLSRFKPVYEINSCYNKVSCSVAFNNAINSEEEFKGASCVKDKYYLQSFIKNSEREYTLLTKDCSESIEGKEDNNQGETSKDDAKKILIEKCSSLAKTANELGVNKELADESLDKFCNEKFNTVYDNTIYKTATCYALSKRYYDDFVYSLEDTVIADTNKVPEIILDSCEKGYKLFFDFNDELQLSEDYREYVNCLSNPNGKNCIYSLISETYPICKVHNINNKQIQFFYTNESGFKDLITLPFKCGDYKNIEDSCSSLYDQLKQYGPITNGFCDKQMNVFGDGGVSYKDATCFSINYESFQESYDPDEMEKCYNNWYLIPLNSPLHNNFVDAYKDYTSKKISEQDFINEIKGMIKCDNIFNNPSGYNSEIAETYTKNLKKGGMIQALIQSENLVDSYTLVQFPFYCG